MAIFSANHTSVGRSTHRAGTAGAHAKYILRQNAVSLVLGANMPTSSYAAMAWLNEQEEAGRKNERMIDKVRLALPVELNAVQRAELVTSFAEGFTKGRGSWVAGIHDRGEDEANPHAHLIIRDKDFETGKRVAGLSEKGSTERIREAWQVAANRALEMAGREERIDRRSLKDQGIEREAGIHMGPVALAMREKGREPESQVQTVTMRNGQERVIDWPSIDQGRTRADRQDEIEAANRQREIERKQQELERVAKAQEEALQRSKVQQVEIPVQKPEIVQRAAIEQERALQQEPVTPREPVAIERSQAKPEDRPAPRLMERVMDMAAELGRRVIDRAREMVAERMQRPPSSGMTMPAAVPEYAQQVVELTQRHDQARSSPENVPETVAQRHARQQEMDRTIQTRKRDEPQLSAARSITPEPKQEGVTERIIREHRERQIAKGIDPDAKQESFLDRVTRQQREAREAEQQRRAGLTPEQREIEDRKREELRQQMRREDRGRELEMER